MILESIELTLAIKVFVVRAQSEYCLYEINIKMAFRYKYNLLPCFKTQIDKIIYFTVTM